MPFENWTENRTKRFGFGTVKQFIELSFESGTQKIPAFRFNQTSGVWYPDITLSFSSRRVFH